MLFFTRQWAGRGPPRAVSSDQAGREKCTGPAQSTVLWCWGRIRPAPEPAGGDGCSSLGRRRKCVGCGADCTVLIGRSSQRDGWRPAHRRPRVGGAHFFPKGRFVTWRASAVVRQDLLVALVRRISAPPIRCRREVPCRWQRSLERAKRPFDLWPCWRRWGPCWGSRNPAATAWTSRSGDPWQNCVRRSAGSPDHGLPSLHRGEALLFHSWAPRPGQSGAIGVALSPRLITQG